MRSLVGLGKVECVIQEMKMLRVDILALAETHWKDAGDFVTQLPGQSEKFRIIFSGGNQHRRGVGFIVRNEVAKSIMQYDTRSVCY